MGAPDGERGTSCEPPGYVEPPTEPTLRIPPPRTAVQETAGTATWPAEPRSVPAPVAVHPGTPDGAAAPPRSTHRWGIGAYLLVEAIFIGVSLLLGLAFLGQRLSVGALTLALTVPTVLAAGTAVLITRLRGNGPRVDLGLVWSWHDVKVGALYGVGGLAITLPASLLYLVLVGPENASSAVGDVFAGLRAGPVAAAGVALVVVVLAPFCEEIVYRGLLWGALERSAWPRWVPFVGTTVLFALAHFEVGRTPLLLVVALPIALARLRTGRLAASVVAHQINNLIPGLALAAALLGVLPV